MPEGIRKLSGLARFTRGAPTSQLSLLAMAYHNQWSASDQIPLRAVQQGLLSRFGQLDSTDGGNALRLSLSGSYRHVGSRSTQLVQLHAIRSELALFSDFTYFLEDPVRGASSRRPISGRSSADSCRTCVSSPCGEPSTLSLQGCRRAPT